MDLGLTADQRMIRASAESVLSDVASSTRVRKDMSSPMGFDPAVWQRLGGELGWCAIPIPDEQGGLGLGPVELVQLFEPMGRQLACTPYFSTVALATALLVHIGDEAAQAEWLPAVAEGRLRATAPMPAGAGDGWIGEGAGLRALGSGPDFLLSGVLEAVMDGATADLLLVPAALADSSVGWFAIATSAEGLRREALNGWDLTRRFARIHANEVRGIRFDAGGRVAAGLPRAAAQARLCLAAEQLGGAQACLDLTAAYVATRKQFGRAVGGFQAVKHRCAGMMVAIEALRSAVYGAAAAQADPGIDEGFALETVMALAQAKDSYFSCAQEAIQMHGGVGFTWEYDPQLHLKRAQAGSHWMGTAAALRERIASEIIA